MAEPKERKRGRPPLIMLGYDPDATETHWRSEEGIPSPAAMVISAIRNSLFREAAAELAGISKQCLYDWLQHGRDHHEDDPIDPADQPYVYFADAVTRAERRSEFEIVVAWKNMAL